MRSLSVATRAWGGDGLYLSVRPFWLAGRVSHFGFILHSSDCCHLAFFLVLVNHLYVFFCEVSDSLFSPLKKLGSCIVLLSYKGSLYILDRSSLSGYRHMYSEYFRPVLLHF